MRSFRFWPQMALVLALSVMNGGCVLIPELKDRIVELAVGGSTVVELTTNGDVNTLDDTDDVNVVSGLDIAGILADANVDVSDVTSIKFTGVEYRVTVPDPQADRAITDGLIEITRDPAGTPSGPYPLISDFNAGAGTGNAVTSWTAAAIDPDGNAVTQINNILAAILTGLQGGATPSAGQTTIRYHVTGTSSPTGIATNFTYEIKLKITITGTVKVKVPA